MSGDVRESLCEAVKKFGVDFLVVGSHGYGIIKRYICSHSDNFNNFNATGIISVNSKLKVNEQEDDNTTLFLQDFFGEC